LTQVAEHTIREVAGLLARGLYETYEGKLQIASPVFLELYIKELFDSEGELRPITFQGEVYEIPPTHVEVLYDDSGVVESVAVLNLNTPPWCEPYLSIDMIVTRDRTPKQLFRLMSSLEKLIDKKYLEEGWPHLPILLETKLPPVVKRFFEKKKDKFPHMEIHPELFSIAMLTF